MILVNARYTLRRPTGVDVHAHEVVERLHGVELVVPGRWAASGPVAHLWEQTMLPWRARGHTLWSPCNTGPRWSGSQLMTVHDVSALDCPEFFTPVYRAQASMLGRRTSEHADAIATVSEFSKRRIVANLDVHADRVHVVGNGVRTEVLAAHPAGPFGGADAPLVTVGSLEPRKRLDRLVAAYRSAACGSALRIIGAANSRIYGTAGIAAGGGVSLLGYLPVADMIDELRKAAAFFYVSAYEGFGLPPVEAAALGVPVVVSDIEAHREVLDGFDGVYFVSTDDELVSCMRAAARGELSRPNAEAVRERHSWDRVAAAYCRILSDEFQDGDVAVRV